MENPKGKILIIEDEIILARMYQRKFQSDDYEALIAYDGEEGLKLAEKEKPDAVLLDLMLPKIGGFEILKKLKENKETSKIPVIILTNLGTSQILINEGLKLGAEDYLIKLTTSSSEVIEKVKKLIQKGKHKDA